MFKLAILPPISRRLLRVSSCRLSSNESYTRSHYDVLGVSKNSSTDEIKKAYYEQSKQHHPDKKDGNPEMFKELTSAYEVLGNSRLRKMYDKGLISHDSSTIYDSGESDKGESRAASAPSAPEQSISAPALDEWSKKQYSRSFARDQHRRTEAWKKTHIRHRKADVSTTQFTLIFALLGAFFIAYYLEKGRLSSTTPKKTDR